MNSLFLRDLCAALVLSFGHFLWIGTLIAIVAAVAVRRRRTAAARCRVWLAAFAMMAASPFVTLVVLMSATSAEPVPAFAPTLSVSEQQAPSVGNIPTDPADDTRRMGTPARPLPDETGRAGVPTLQVDHTANGSTEQQPTATDAPQHKPAWWRDYAPLVTSLYLIGVALMGLRLSFGLWGGRRLRRRVTPITDASLLAALQRQATSLGMTFVPALAYCERVAVPTVLGILKPMILLPVSLASGLAPDQIESVLAHELAHLRRYDHLVNLMQCVIESLLFFHPAVWWVSRRIRDEREHCCDDLVVACGAVPLDYAKSLLRVAELSREAEQQRGHNQRRSFAAVSLFATGDRPSTLRQRIARLLDVPVESRVRLRHPWTACGLLAASLSIAWLTAAAQRPIAAQPEETDPDEAAAQADESDVKPDRKLNDDDSVAASEFNHGVTEEQKRNLIELRDRVRKIVPQGWQIELRFGAISMDRPGRKQDAHWVRWSEAMLYFNNEDTTSEIPPIADGTQIVSLGLCKLGYATLAMTQPMLAEWPESRTQLQAVLPEADDAARQAVQPLKAWPLVVGTLRYEDGSPVKGALVGPVGRAKVPLGDDGRYQVRVDPNWGRLFVSLKDVRDWPSNNSPPRDPAYLREVLDIKVIEVGPSVVRRNITLNRTQLRTVKLWWNGPTTKGRLRLYSNPPKDWLTDAAVPQNERPAGDKQVAVPGERQLLVISRTLDVTLEHGKQFVINDVPPGDGHVGITLAETSQPLAWPLTGGEEDEQLVYNPADTGSVDVKVLGDDGAPLKQLAILNVMRLLPNMVFGVFNSAAGDQCDLHRPVFDAKTQTHRVSHLQPGRYQANVTLESLFGPPVLFDVFKDEVASVVLSISQTPVAAIPLGVEVKAATVVGTVASPNGKPVAGIEVLAFQGGRQLEQKFTTDERGEFRVPKAWREVDHWLTVVARDGRERLGWFDFMVHGHSIGGQKSEDGSFRMVLLPMSRTIRGRVLDESGQPLAQIPVRINQLDHEVNSNAVHWKYQELAGEALILGAVTDNDGRFELKLPANTFAWLGTSHLDWVESRIRVTKENDEVGDTKLVRAAKVAGRVIDSRTGKPLAGITIAAQATKTEILESGGEEAKTDAEGNYLIQGLRSGEYTIQLEKSPFKTLTAPAIAKAMLKSGETFPTDFSLIVGKRLAGRVLDMDTGEPIPNCKVNCSSPARPGSDGHSTKTNKLGEFEFLVPPGRSTLDARAGRRFGSESTRQVDVPAEGDPEPVDLKVGADTEAVPDRVKIFIGPPLDRKVSLHFQRAPLVEVLEHACQAAAVKLELDGDGLKSMGYTKNMPVTIDSDNVTLRDALTQVLKPFGKLSFTVDKNRVFVSTHEQIKTREKQAVEPPAPVAPPQLRVLHHDGIPATFNHVVQAGIGFPDAKFRPWMEHRDRDGLVPLAKLPVGKHWLVAAPEFATRTAFLLTMPPTQPMVEQRLLAAPAWGSAGKFSLEPTVVGQLATDEEIVVTIQNSSNGAISIGEEDLSLTMFSVNYRILSPTVIQPETKRPRRLNIAAGAEGELRINWLKWVQHGLWVSRAGEAIDEPWSAKNVPGKIQVRVEAGQSGAVPVFVTEPKSLLLAAGTSPPVGLEFLTPYPKLHGLSLDMTEPQFWEIVKQSGLKAMQTVDGDKGHHYLVLLGDDHALIVMFDKDAKCSGIQRVRGEDKQANERDSATTQPQSKVSQALFQKWLRGRRGNGNIPGGTLGPLVRVMTNFVKNNPTHEGSPKFAELLKRIDVTRDWSRDEAVKLLDEVAAIYPSLPEWVEGENRFALGGDVVVGKPLPEELKNAPWGEAQPNGLRVAWLLEPRGAEHRLNTPLKSRVLFHNSGKNAVVFRALTWNQSGGHKARDAQGTEININSTEWTTIPSTFACRLAPGEFLEVVAAGIGVGANKDDEDWRDARSDFRVGVWIEAKAGDEVTFSPAAVDCDGRDAPQPEGDGAQAAPQSWWLKFIKDRLSLDAPLPADADERGRMLDRAVRDLFGNAPTKEELTAFKNDATPEAFEALAKRLAERSGFESFSGSLISGPTKFKVLPVDPDAAKKPRTAKNPGQYKLGGNVTFVVTRRPIGERVVNEAHLAFAPTDATQPAPRKSHPVPLPDDYDTWIAAWMRGGTVLWVAQKGADQKESIHRYDFRNPATVRETVITELKPGETLPQAILDVFSTRSQAEMGNAKGGLEFLKPYPKLHGLSLGMTEPQFLEIVKQQELKTRKTVEGEKVTHHIALGDGHTLIVMFDKDAKCSGIQRVRGVRAIEGLILSIDQKRGVAVISLGAGDTVTRLMKFEVRAKAPARDKADEPVVKGTVEVIRVEQDTSEVRILKQDAANKITEGDYVIPVDEKTSAENGPPELRVLRKPALLLPDHWIVMAVGFDHEGQELVTAATQSFVTIRRWDVVSKKLISEIKLEGDQHGRPFREGTLLLSGDRRRVLAATDAYVGIWETATGKLLKQLPFKTKEGIYDCAIDMLDCTPDLSVIVGHRALPGRLTLSYDAHVIVWDGVSGNVLQTVIDKGATDLKAIDLSTDGKRLVTTNGGGAKIWETSTGQLLRSIPNDNAGDNVVVRSANQRMIAERSTTMTRHVWSVQFSPDGKQLAMGDILGVKLLDATSGKLLQQLEGPYRYSSNASPGLVFSKDGQWLARLGTQEKTEGDKHHYVVPIWSTRTGQKRFELHTNANDAVFSDDCQRLAVVFSDMQQALSVWPLGGDAANVEQTAGPGPHSRQDRVEENGHYVGKTAAEFIDKLQPTWGDTQLGLQYGIALTKPQRKFRSGERVPLVVFFRNASDKPIKFNTAPDFFGNTPKVHNAKGEPIALENIPLLGHIPHYNEQLAPGEALGPFYLNFGLGENPRPGQQHWHPYFKTPAAGQYKLTHSASINVAGQKDGDPSTRADITSSTVEFEIVDGVKPVTDGQANNPPAAALANQTILLADAVRDFNAENKKRGRGLDQPPLTEDEVVAAIKRSDWKRDVPDVGEREFSAFKAIAETRQLPKGSELEVLTGMQPDAFTLIQLWSIRVIMSALEREGTTGFTVRHTKLSEEKIDPKSVAWGKPDSDGLSLGLYLAPKKDKYQIGERVQLRLFVRNEGKKAVDGLTFMNITWPVADDFTVTDQTGAKVAVRNGHEEWSSEMWIAGAVSGRLDPGDAHAFRVPFEVGIGGDGSNKLIGRVIEARPSQTLQLKVREHNGSDRKRKEGEAAPESGSITFAVADKGNAADLN